MRKPINVIASEARQIQLSAVWRENTIGLSRCTGLLFDLDCRASLATTLRGLLNYLHCRADAGMVIAFKICYAHPMFWPDVIALKEFYASPLGLVAQDAISRRIAAFWPEGRGDTLLGIGFTHPYLLAFLQDSPGVFSCMPAPQGVLHWPPLARNLALLSDEGDLPFADNSINRVLVVHALENTQALSPMLAEIWRVLSPAGRLLVIAPNRRGIWARSPNSPFAYGQPFTATQLRQLLAEHSFTPLQAAAALFFPPSTRRTLLKTASFFERLGPYFFSGFGGVLLMQAEKQIYAPTAKRLWQKSRRSYGVSAQPAVSKDMGRA